MDCSPLGFSAHGIFQARILKWVAISYSREASPRRDPTRVSCNSRRFFTTEPPGKPIYHCRDSSLKNWLEISLVVQWLRLCASTAGGVGLITGPGTKIPKATGSGKATVLIMSLFKKPSVAPYYPHPLCPSWRRERLPTPVFWPGEFHGLCTLRGHKESDVTEWLSLHLCL